ncbi:hypothetical protein MX663_03790 [Bacillus subtilis]|uniref:hypothetical protein n=1 Tax=Bacillus subtilis TaxID=1423 RepID=UPI001FFAD410|nr:hypothetical protein [Bacillus subtilis]UPG82311.1 hypothetical protein MX663_03790 [Bacillus subtilis]
MNYFDFKLQDATKVCVNALHLRLLNYEWKVFYQGETSRDSCYWNGMGYGPYSSRHNENGRMFKKMLKQSVILNPKHLVDRM